MALKNQIKTVVLLALLSALFVWVGSLWGQNGLMVGLAFALLMNFGTYWFSDKVVLAMYRAKPINKEQNRRLQDIVNKIRKEMNLPMPRIYIIPSDSANAFATGRNPKHSALAFTAGILSLLDKNELEGVVAHEMNHIKHRDTLISTIAATIAAVISFVAMMARWGAIFGGYNNRDSGNLLELLVLAILTPLIATILQLAISRSREYMADEGAAKVLHTPDGLIGALRRLEENVKKNPIRFGNKSTASLFIVHPFKAKGFLKLFSTHPSTDDRIEKLKEFY